MILYASFHFREDLVFVNSVKHIRSSSSIYDIFETKMTANSVEVGASQFNYCFDIVVVVVVNLERETSYDIINRCCVNLARNF